MKMKIGWKAEDGTEDYQENECYSIDDIHPAIFVLMMMILLMKVMMISSAKADGPTPPTQR